MKAILSFTILSLIFISCKKEKTATNPTNNEPEVDYRIKYNGEYNCNGTYFISYEDLDSSSDYIDTLAISYTIEKSGDSSIIIEGRTLKIEKDGYFGPRYYNTKFENPPHGLLTDSTIYYSKDIYLHDTIVGSYFKRLRIYGTKK